MRTRHLLATTAVVLSLFGIAGCSSGDAVVSGSELAKEVKPLVKKKAGKDPEKIECKELKAKVDATTTCQMTLDGDEVALKVTATKVDGDDVKFSVEVDGGGSADTGTTTTEAAPDETTEAEPTETTEAAGPVSVAPDELTTRLAAALQDQFGGDVPTVTCPDPLEGTVGATATCTLSDGTDTVDVGVTVTQVDGTDVAFDYKVADATN